MLPYSISLATLPAGAAWLTADLKDPSLPSGTRDPSSCSYTSYQYQPLAKACMLSDVYLALLQSVTASFLEQRTPQDDPPSYGNSLQSSLESVCSYVPMVTDLTLLHQAAKSFCLLMCTNLCSVADVMYACCTLLLSLIKASQVSAQHETRQHHSF